MFFIMQSLNLIHDSFIFVAFFAMLILNYFELFLVSLKFSLSVLKLACRVFPNSSTCSIHSTSNEGTTAKTPIYIYTPTHTHLIHLNKFCTSLQIYSQHGKPAPVKLHIYIYIYACQDHNSRSMTVVLLIHTPDGGAAAALLIWVRLAVPADDGNGSFLWAVDFVLRARFAVTTTSSCVTFTTTWDVCTTGEEEILTTTFKLLFAGRLSAPASVTPAKGELAFQLRK